MAITIRDHSSRAYQVVKNASFSEDFANMLNEWSLKKQASVKDFFETEFSQDAWNFGEMTRKSNNIRKIVKKETEINSEKAVFGISDIKLTNHPKVND